MNSPYFLSSSTFCLVLLLLFFFPVTTSQHITNSCSSLDGLIQTVAFHPPPHLRSNHPYHLHLPSNLSSITAIARRIRGATLWLRGTNLGSFRLPPDIITTPFVRRTLLVFYDLGNLSSSFFSVPGYVLVAPVVAFLAYDASNVSFVDGIREVSLRPTRDPITIVFPPVDELSVPAQCVRFGLGCSVWLGGAVGKGMRCEVRETGHFSVVVRALPPEGEGRGWSVWVWVLVGVGCGVVSVVGLGVRCVRRKKRRMEEMQRSGEEGEVLDSVWVGGSKLPAAAVARTTPAIESDGAHE